MLRSAFHHFVPLALLVFSATANAATFSFLTDPFAGSNALITPGRQVVGGEPSIVFSIGSDTFEFDAAVFGVTPPLTLVNDLAANIPAGGADIVVLRTFDDDSNAATPFGAGSAANLIAAAITSPGPGFFIYFNQGLALPRLVYSTDLNDSTADLKILARLTNLNGQAGQDALVTFQQPNFTTTPEPSSLILMTAAAAVLAGNTLRRRRMGRRQSAVQRG